MGLEGPVGDSTTLSRGQEIETQGKSRCKTKELSLKLTGKYPSISWILSRAVIHDGNGWVGKANKELLLKSGQDTKLEMATTPPTPTPSRSPALGNYIASEKPRRERKEEKERERNPSL